MQNPVLRITDSGSIPLGIRIKEDTITCIISHGLRIFSSTIREDKEMSGLKLEREDIRLQLLADNITICLKNPRESTLKYCYIRGVLNKDN